MEHMNTMKSSVLSAREFFQLTVNSLLELCTHCIDGHRIVSIEGRLLLTLDTGDKVALNIHQQNVSTSLNSVEDADVNNSSSHVTADVPKDLDGELSLKAEPVFKVEDSVDIESLINVQKSDNNADSDTQWRSYPCRDCDDMLFTSDGLLRWHRVQMHRPHKCQKCGTVLIGRRNFSQHVRKVHPGLPISKAEKSFVCEYCSQTFADEAQMNDHISTIHLQAIEHRCDQCGKMLGSALTLRIHQRQLHEHSCQQTCDGCGRQFTRLDGLIEHLTCSHPHLLPDKYRRRLDDLVCKDCDFTFSRPSSLKRHMEVRHGGEPKYICPICSRRFRSQRYVHRHVRSHHPTINSIAAAKRSSVVVGITNDNSASASDVLQ